MKQNNNFGNFYEYTTLSGKTEKYYLEKANFQLEKELNKVKEIPGWCRDLSHFLSRLKMDNVFDLLEGTISDSVENQIIHQMIVGGLSGDMTNYDVETLAGMELVSFLREILAKHLPRKMKDKMWEMVLID